MKPTSHRRLEARLISVMHARRGGRVRALPLLFFALTLACGETRQAEYPASPPLKRLFYYGDHLAVELDRSARIAQLVDLGAFGPFQPGTSLEQAVRKHGPPATVVERDDDVFYRYNTAAGYVELSQERADDSVDPKIRVWRLRAFPSDARGTYVLQPPLARLVEGSIRTMNVSDGGYNLRIAFADGGVKQLWWGRESVMYE